MSRFPAKIDGCLEHELVWPSRQAETYPTILLLHGRGATASDLLPLVPELGFEEFLAIAPQAPHELRGVFGLGFAWYHLEQMEGGTNTSITVGLRQLDDFINAVIAGYPIDRERLFLLGFSQGAVMALAAGLVKPGRVAGIAALSGYLDESSMPDDDVVSDKPPIFIGHGTNDQVIPIEAGQRSRDVLIARGIDVRYREYPAGHVITPEELTDVRYWLESLLD